MAETVFVLHIFRHANKYANKYANEPETILNIIKRFRVVSAGLLKFRFTCAGVRNNRPN